MTTLADIQAKQQELENMIAEFAEQRKPLRMSDDRDAWRFYRGDNTVMVVYKKRDHANIDIFINRDYSEEAEWGGFYAFRTKEGLA